jgi:hypothetical protein
LAERESEITVPVATGMISLWGFVGGLDPAAAETFVVDLLIDSSAVRSVVASVALFAWTGSALVESD